MAAHPVDVLLEVADPLARGRAHVELGRKALDLGERDRARRHFAEAAALAPEDPAVRDALSRMGEPSVAPPRRTRWFGWSRRS